MAVFFCTYLIYMEDTQMSINRYTMQSYEL